MGYLVTGSKGFIGRNLINYMDKKDIKYFIPYNRYKYNAWMANNLIHLSAATNIRESIKNPVGSFNRNTKNTFEWLMFAYEEGINNFIFASSMSATNPRSPYLASKACGEAYCKAFKASYGINTYIARFSNVYGPCSEYKDSVIPKYIKAAMSNKPFYIYGDGKQFRDFIYVDDVIKTVLNLNKPITNVISGSIISINELVELLNKISKDLLGREVEIKYTDASPGEITKMSPKKGIPNPTPLIDGLRKTFKWFLKYQ